MRFLLFCALILVFLGGVLLKKALASLSLKEFKRRARGQDALSAKLYKLASFGASAQLLLWLFASASFAALIILTARSSWWLAVLFVVIALWLMWSNRPLKTYGNLAWKSAALLALPTAKLVSWLQPLLGRLGGFKSMRIHSGLYEKEDLLDFLKQQARQADNRIVEGDLKIAFNALQFGDKKISEVMRPRRNVKWVGENDPISPVVMDELHNSGLSAFPVVKDVSKKSTSPEVVGTLYLSDLVGQQDSGKVRDVMKRDVFFINESDNLRASLDAFIKSHHHILVVINSFEEVVGVLTFEMVLEQILGEKVNDEFDRYQDKRAVASKENTKKEHLQPEQEPVKPSKSKKS